MPNPFRQVVASIPKTMGEAVVKPTVDEAGKMVETGVSSVFGTTNTQTQQKNPQQMQAENQRKADEEKKRQNILRYFDALKANAQVYKSQQDFQKTQTQQEQIAQEQKIKQFEIQKNQKKQQQVDVYRAQRKSEIKVKGG
jgi:hypothetical protein